jgi:hypothetical protein
VADGGRAVDELGLVGLVPTQEVLADLFAWASVTPLPGAGRPAVVATPGSS